MSQAFCSAACHWFGVVACKIHAVRMSFALPLCITGPAVLLVGLAFFIAQIEQIDGSKSITGEHFYFKYTYCQEFFVIHFLLHNFCTEPSILK